MKEPDVINMPMPDVVTRSPGKWRLVDTETKQVWAWRGGTWTQVGTVSVKLEAAFWRLEMKEYSKQLRAEAREDYEKERLASTLSDNWTPFDDLSPEAQNEVVVDYMGG